MHNRNNNRPYVFDYNSEQLEDDFVKMEALKTTVYCYPYGEHSKEILSKLSEKNYRMAFKLNKSGISKRTDDKYLIPRVGINAATSFDNFKKWLFKAEFM